MTPTVPVDLEIKDFTEDRKRILFKIDGDVFECNPQLPILSLLDFAAMADQVGDKADDAAKNMFLDMFNMVLIDESAAVFIERMRDKRRPISITQVNDILPWIMEQFGLRPTQPSAPSSPGSEIPDGGLSSTEIALPEASTSDPWQSPAFST